MTKERSRSLDSVLESAQALHDAGVMDSITMKEFEALCLPPTRQYAAGDVKALRERLHVSQPVLARFLGVTKSTVAQWEQGDKKPGGPARKLLDLLDRKGLDAIL